MASPHSLLDSFRTPHHSLASSDLPSLQMPNVFIVPPEEDQLSPWCCFDAAEASPESDLSAILDNEVFGRSPVTCLQDFKGPFEYQNLVVLPKKNLETNSVTDSSIDDNLRDLDDRTEREQTWERNTVGEDSEIVEVVKVRRDDRRDKVQGDSEAQDKVHKTFKSRASKAFKVLRQVGKSSTWSKRQAQNIFIPTSSTENESSSRSRTPTVSRRGSVILSQLFHPPISINTCSSVSLSEARSIPSPRSSSSISNQTLPSPLLHDSPSPVDLMDPPCSSSQFRDVDQQHFRSPSPTPSTQTFSPRRRFSAISLQRIFSFPSLDPTIDIVPRTSNISRDSTGPSSASSLGPDTPTEETTPFPFSSNEKVNFPHSKATEVVPTISPGDISFEMRLDSLHFESLSFDADRF